MTSSLDPQRPLHVLFLAWRDLEHPEAGGSEVYVHRIARELVAMGHRVTIRTARPPGTARREDVDGVRVDRRGGRLSVYPWGLAHVLSRAGRRADVVVDVVNGLPFGAPLVRRRGVLALIHHVHREQWQLIYPDVRGRVGWFVESRIVPRLYRGRPVVTVSEATRADLVALGFRGDHVTVVRNGLDVPPAPAEAKSVAPRLVVLARLVPHKQIEHALDVLAQTRDRHPTAHLDIVGDGWWRERLAEHADRLGVRAQVTFHGHVEPEVRDRLLARAWLMVLPSVKEGWSIAVTEAAAMGTPTIGYRRSGGLCESIADGVTGWLVDDRTELLRTVVEILSAPEEAHQRGRAARRAALRLDWGESATAFVALLAGRLSGRRR